MAVLTAVAQHDEVTQARDLQASILTTQDADEDGITDRQEYTFGTSPFLRDTDSDGYEDGEELALGTSPVLSEDYPGALEGEETRVGVSLLAHGGLGNTHVELMMLSSDGDLDDKPMAVSMRTASGFFPLNLNRIAAISTIREVVRQDGTLIQTWTIPLSPTLAQANEEIHWIAVIGKPGESEYSAAATVRLLGDSDEDMVFWTRTDHTLPPSTSGEAPPQGLQIDQPIPPLPGENPLNPPGTPGQVCVQVTSVVGSGGGSTVISEVISADCESGWSAFCAETVCSSNVGRTFEKINPRSLLGG